MHQKRQAVTKKLPIPRKGTKYVARPLSHLQDSVPVVIAVRNMLNLAGTVREVKQMIKQKQLKVNGKEVSDYRESIRLFNFLKADKDYVLTLSQNGKFTLEETKAKDRMCKVFNKTLIKNGKIQLNLHDGTNVITNEKIKTHDTVYLDNNNRISKHIPLEKSKSCVIISGKYLGSKGHIDSVGDKVSIKLQDNSLVKLEKRSVMVL